MTTTGQRPSWHLVTGEYPPQRGGVSDYSALVAAALAAAGDETHVWCPPAPGDTPRATGVVVHREMGRFTGADLERADQLLDAIPGPRRLLVQWVPHAFGYRSMNLGFCRWLWRRAAHRGDELYVMAHEAFSLFGEGGWKQSVAATAHRAMVTMLLRRARHVWVSVPGWEPMLRRYALGREIPFEWLPIPSNVPVVDDPAGVAAIRARFAGKDGLIGHFGTYGPHTEAQLLEMLPVLLARTGDERVLLLGRGSHEFRARLLTEGEIGADRVFSTGGLPAEDISRHISACDLFLQPYPEGLTGRRGSALAVLAHGVPMVSTTGIYTERVWKDRGAVALARLGDPDALVDLATDLATSAGARARMSLAARELYEERFSLEHTVNSYRRVAEATRGPS